MYYKLKRNKIDIASPVKIVIPIIIIKYDLKDFILRDKNKLFISKFKLSLGYFLSIKQTFLNTFYACVNNEIKK